MDGFYLIVAHLLGDFVIQNDWMATGKKRSTFICAVHSFLYVLPFIPIGLTVAQFLLIAGQHHLQDRDGFVLWYMHKTGKEQFATGPCAPWSIFAVDGTFHLLWIYLVMSL